MVKKNKKLVSKKLKVLESNKQVNASTQSVKNNVSCCNFEQNIGEKDKLVRIVVALLLIVAGLFLVQWPLNFLLYFIGIVLLITSYIGYCVIYKILGINTK